MKRRGISVLSFFLFSFLIPALAFAADNNGTIDLSVGSGDMSIRFLSNIFGVVDGVLHGSGSQIFGAMFGVFNAAVLSLGTAILGYTLFVSTLRTAHEGEALGRNWSSMWIPFKSAAGFALMLPKASGYSMIQIFTMWIVVQGVGAADLVWNAALDYLNSGGAIVQPQTPPMTGSIDMAAKILKAETCMFMVEQALTNEQKKNSEATGTPLAPIPSFSTTITTPNIDNQKDFEKAAGKRTIYFPGELKNANGTPFMEGNFNHICGSVSWSSTEDPGLKRLADARGLAVTQVISDLVPSAQQIAKDYGPFPDAKQNSLGTMSQSLLKDAGNDYEGIVGPAVNLLQGFRSNDLYKFIQDAQTQGWIMAGRFYYELVRLNNSYSAAETSYPEVNFIYPAGDSPGLPTAMKNADTSLKIFFGKESSTPPSPFVRYIDKQKEGSRATDIVRKTEDAIKQATNEVGGGVGSAILALFTGGLTTVIQAYIELGTNQGNAGDVVLISPVSSAAKLGGGLLTFVSSVWIGGAVGIFGITALASICPAANPVGTAVQALLSWFMPLLTALLLLMLTVGAMLAFYVPLIPYILFLFGGIGWLIGVIESIAAAPLVALGIAYPEEHEILGKAQPAIMLLANIFIRPSLMVIGFIAGISLSYVGVWLLNAGFGKASIVPILSTAQPGTLFFLPMAILSIYTALIVQIINQSFGLIHVIPDEVLRWVGGGGRQFGEAAGEQGVKQAFTGDMGTMGKGFAEDATRPQDQKKPKETTGGRPTGGDGGGGGLHVGGGGGGPGGLGHQ